MMYGKTIVNPETGRTNRVRCWRLNPRAAYEDLKANGVKAFSWKLLSDDQSIQLMEDQEAGDSADTNWSLHIFENALDWALGIRVANFIDLFITHRKALPAPFEVAVNRKGDIFIIGKSGKIY